MSTRLALITRGDRLGECGLRIYEGRDLVGRGEGEASFVGAMAKSATDGTFERAGDLLAAFSGVTAENTNGLKGGRGPRGQG